MNADTELQRTLIENELRRLYVLELLGKTRYAELMAYLVNAVGSMNVLN